MFDSPSALVVDPDEVRREGRARAAEHRALADRLASGLDAGRLGRVCAEVARAVDCTACGRCCHSMSPVVSADDEAALRHALGLDAGALRRRYLRPMWPGASESDQVWLLPDPCPLHDGRLCTVYEHRPRVCRDFPERVGPTVADRLRVFAETARTCPITFNVMARLGREEGEGPPQ